MLRVRFATGLTLTYNTGWYAEAWGSDGRISIKEKKDGTLLAIAPADALVEWASPCRIEEPGAQALVRAANDPALLKELPAGVLQRLKVALAAYNRHTGTWRA